MALSKSLEAMKQKISSSPNLIIAKDLAQQYCNLNDNDKKNVLDELFQNNKLTIFKVKHQKKWYQAQVTRNKFNRFMELINNTSHVLLDRFNTGFLCDPSTSSSGKSTYFTPTGQNKYGGSDNVLLFFDKEFFDLDNNILEILQILSENTQFDIPVFTNPKNLIAKEDLHSAIGYILRHKHEPQFLKAVDWIRGAWSTNNNIIDNLLSDTDNNDDIIYSYLDFDIESNITYCVFEYTIKSMAYKFGYHDWKYSDIVHFINLIPCEYIEDDQNAPILKSKYLQQLKIQLVYNHKIDTTDNKCKITPWYNDLRLPIYQIMKDLAMDISIDNCMLVTNDFLATLLNADTRITITNDDNIQITHSYNNTPGNAEFTQDQFRDFVLYSFIRDEHEKTSSFSAQTQTYLKDQIFADTAKTNTLFTAIFNDAFSNKPTEPGCKLDILKLAFHEISKGDFKTLTALPNIKAYIDTLQPAEKGSITHPQDVPPPPPPPPPADRTIQEQLGTGKTAEEVYGLLKNGWLVLKSAAKEMRDDIEIPESPDDAEDFQAFTPEEVITLQTVRKDLEMEALIEAIFFALFGEKYDENAEQELDDDKQDKLRDIICGLRLGDQTGANLMDVQIYIMEYFLKKYGLGDDSEENLALVSEFMKKLCSQSLTNEVVSGQASITTLSFCTSAFKMFAEQEFGMGKTIEHTGTQFVDKLDIINGDFKDQVQTEIDKTLEGLNTLLPKIKKIEPGSSNDEKNAANKQDKHLYIKMAASGGVIFISLELLILYLKDFIAKFAQSRGISGTAASVTVHTAAVALSCGAGLLSRKVIESREQSDEGHGGAAIS